MRLASSCWILLCVLLAVPGVGAADVPPTVLVGIDEAYPPHQFVDERGRAAGFDVELSRAVLERVGMRPEFRPGVWAEVRAALERGEVDVIPGIVKTPERSRVLDFSAPVARIHHSVFIRNDSRVEALSDLVEKRILIQNQGVHHDLLRRGTIPVSGVPVDSPEVALAALAEGEADAAVVLNLLGLHLIRERGLAVRSIGVPLTAWDYRFAVPEGRQALLEAINDGLTQVREDGSYDAIYDRWFGVMRPTGVPGQRVALILGGVVLLALAGLAASARARRGLERTVARRSHQLTEAEQRERLLEQRLRQAERLETLGRLAGGVAHDFNNVLTAILGNASLARSAGPHGREPLAALEEIEASAKAATRITRRLLALSRNHLPGTETVTWPEVFDQVEPILRRLVPDEIALRFASAGDDWPIRLDAGQASQIVLNLVLNARDAIEGTGSIDVRTHSRQRDGRRETCLQVEDDGQGMDEATRRMVFEPFFTTKGEGGTGLGLSTVAGAAREAGGRVDAQAREGGGTRFEVWLPAVEPAPVAPAPGVGATPRGEGERILFVDGDPAVRQVASGLLASLGYRATLVGDGAAALRTLETGPAHDLLVTDPSLPDLSGGELARRARELRPGLRVLYTAHHVERRLDLPSGDAGDAERIAKPFAREELGNAIRRALEGPGG